MKGRRCCRDILTSETSEMDLAALSLTSLMGAGALADNFPPVDNPGGNSAARPPASRQLPPPWPSRRRKWDVL